VNDKGASILDPESVTLTIDGQEVMLVASPKNLDATDFAYTRQSAYPPSSDHTYTIEVRDTAGNVVTDTGSFRTIYYAILGTPMQATSVNQSNPGFIWRVFQNESYTHTSLAETELALAGELVDTSGNPITDNYADPALIGVALAEGVQDGPLYRFEIPTVINLSQYGGEVNGNFTPDDQMPGVPSLTGSDDGVDAEIITFVELPEGWITMGVNSDDGFRTQAGFINNPADGILLGEFDGSRGASDTTFRFLVEDAGIYPIRTIWQDGTGTASIELFTVSEDGTKVLINDTDNDGLRAFRTGQAPERPAEAPEIGSIQLNANGSITITWTAGTLQTAPAVTGPWQDMTGATSPHTFTPTGPLLFGRIRQ
jgi:hypothetical protein